ncbi:MAG: UTP--glucose-1-phosphate uridylyltransferase [Phycisphaerales bacterium]|nr:UTP--glucose-1-phosphate uridylyltransferase [Phycisphaerales bacterium]
MSDLRQRHDAAAARLAEYGQGHLLRFWDELSDGERGELLADIEAVDFARFGPLIETHVRGKPAFDPPKSIEPPRAFPPQPGPDQQELYKRARARGVEAIRAGRVAAFTVAGGQGTRLGYDGPKGGFAISPVRNAPLFQLFAEGLRGVERRWGRAVDWHIMTSPANHDETIRLFESANWYGLRRGQVRFFKQAQAPAFHQNGLVALEQKHRIALSPDGHGGSLAALRASGALEQMRAAGVDVISYFQVDNPLVKPIDPLFIGLHLEMGSEMSSKAVAKAHDHERVGAFCDVDGKLQVIEYSDLPEALAVARNPDGSRRFDAGSIAIHVISRELVERLTDPRSAAPMPWHRALKRVPFVNDAGQTVNPSEPNAVKLEMFVFDAVPLAKNPLVLFTPRAEEFSPVKNAEGDDSPATTRRDLIRRAAKWLAACGVNVPRGADGEPPQPIEISPEYAIDVDDLKERLGGRAPHVDWSKPALLA